MQVGCNLLVPDHLVNRLIDAELFKKYLMFTSKAFVEGSNMKWCPKPGCTNAIHSYTREGKCSVSKCSCGFKFCWRCLEEAHTPATCDLVARWRKKCEDDSETYNWIASNTKSEYPLLLLLPQTPTSSLSSVLSTLPYSHLPLACPKCKICIEKNDGCFQMTCRQCRFQWCWLCCEDWKTHSDHFSCTKYKGTKVSNKPQFQSQETHQEALDRYLHYYNLYNNHLNSLKHEDKTREKAREKMQELLNQDHENFYYNVDFIEEALVALLEVCISNLLLLSSSLYLYYLFYQPYFLLSLPFSVAER
jgi:ariadne-1